MSNVILQQPLLAGSTRVLQGLFPRDVLSPQETQQLENRLKGFQGEVFFAELSQKDNEENWLILHNLRLEINDAEFEMDCLVLQNAKIHLFEVKNYEGDFLYDNGKWFVVHNKKEISDPLAQLHRSEMLLKQTLQGLNLNIPVLGYVVFVHPNFQLYQAPLGKSIIYPTQLKRFLLKFRENTTPIQDWHQNIMNRLSAMHIANSRHARLPEYDFTNLRKGVFCKSCIAILSRTGRDFLYCRSCDVMEYLEEGMLRMTKEFIVLFPEKKITTRKIFIWCGEIVSMKVTRRILQKHLKMLSYNRGTHFIFKSE